MPTTPRLALPYPVLTDTANVPRDVQALADRLDLVTAADTELDTLAASVATLEGKQPTYVTSLPGSPVDGQEIYYAADATNGVIWHLRYRGASASAYKWEYLGGGLLQAERAAGFDNITGTTYGNTGSGGVGVAVPLGGDYMIEFGATVGARILDNAIYVTVKLGAAAASDNESIAHVQRHATTASAPSYSLARKMRRNGLAAAALLAVQHKVLAGGAGTAEKHFIVVTPVRVG